MPFECQQCGECCSHLGLVHIIHKDLGDHRFAALALGMEDGKRSGWTMSPTRTRNNLT